MKLRSCIQHGLMNVTKVVSAFLACLVVAGCAGTSTTPHSYSVCSTQPGTYACQIEQYGRVGF
jgi:hypothetical protein